MLLSISIEAEPFSVGLTSKAYWSNNSVSFIPKGDISHFSGADFSLGAYLKVKRSVEGLFFVVESGLRKETLYFDINQRKSISKRNHFFYGQVQVGYSFEFIELLLAMNILYNFNSDLQIDRGAVDLRPNYQINFLLGDFVIFAGLEHSVFTKDYTYREESKQIELSRFALFTGVSYELF